jgi:hypothetical protein
MSVPGVNGPSAAAGLQMELLVQALTRELDQAQQLQQAGAGCRRRARGAAVAGHAHRARVDARCRP